MAALRPNPTLSDDLISEILVRVPVKSLLCFQLVCKAWISLIKHPAFVKSQLRHAIKTKTDQTLIISHFKYGEGNKFLLLDVDSRQIVADLKRPYSRGDLTYQTFPRLVGSANGIVFVDVGAINTDGYVQKDSSIYLWNPAIRQSKLIPSCNIGYAIDEQALGFGFDEQALGFGYDWVDHDYKVVRVVGIESPASFHAEVYSDNRNAWRNLPDPIDIPYNGHFDVLVNGFLCGIGENGIMAFDLNKEVLNCAIKFPVIDDVRDHALGRDDFQILEFSNSLAVILLMNDGSNVGKTNWRICIWMLNEHACLRGGGVEASWTPMFCVNLATPGLLMGGFFSNGNFRLMIIDDDQMWISCHDDKKEAKIVPLSIDMSDHLYSHHIYKYTESLVSLVGFRHVKWNAGEDDD